MWDVKSVNLSSDKVSFDHATAHATVGGCEVHLPVGTMALKGKISNSQGRNAKKEKKEIKKTALFIKA